MKEYTFSSVFIEQYSGKSVTRGRKEDTLQKSLAEFDKGLSLWLQRITAEPENKYYLSTTGIHKWMDALNLYGRLSEASL